jgi:hypothetical protein
MTVEGERTTAFGADRDSLTCLPLAPLPVRPRGSGRTEAEGSEFLAGIGGT